MSKKPQSEFVALYFKKTSNIIEKHLPESIVTLQFFQRKENVILAGMNEVLELLNKNTDTSKYSIKHLNDGDIINPMDIVLELEGHYAEFGIYEGMIDGILARSSSIATNASKCISAANGKQVINMADRADHYSLHAIDGLASSIGGLSTQVTDAQVSLHDGTAVGTVPHALIQMFEGDLVKALEAYASEYPEQGLTALIDYNNDVITDGLKVLKHFGQKLKMVRVDTSQNMSDAYFKNDEELGVTPNLIKALRKALDDNDGSHVKIVVSSGFNEAKIKAFELENAPVDFYGVGASLLDININFSADAVKINGKLNAKKGRAYKKFEAR